MRYSLRETKEAIEDITRQAAYMIEELENHKAALDFLDKYDEEVKRLACFPFGYRGISLEYRGYEIKLKSFGTYNIFFVVDMNENTITILRLLKDRQDWSAILKPQNDYHF